MILLSIQTSGSQLRIICPPGHNLQFVAVMTGDC